MIWVISCAGWKNIYPVQLPRPLRPECFTAITWQCIFDETLNTSDQVDYFPATAIGLTRQEDFWVIHLDNGSSIETRSVVLALGNHLLPKDPIDLSGVEFNYYRNPWSPEITKNLASTAPVLLIGTGLTMVDVALYFAGNGTSRHHPRHLASWTFISIS